MIRSLLLSTLVALPTTALADRVLSIGGSVTEIVYALGEQERLVGRDSTSTFPTEATALPDVGYIRQLSPEGVLSVNPDLIISETGAGPLEAVELLRAADVPFIEVADGYTEEAVLQKIRDVAKALDVTEKGEDLAASVSADLDEAEAVAANVEPLRVLFILSTAGGRITAAGENTSASAIIELAGGMNAIQGVEGYKQVSDEAITVAAPDVILMMDRSGDHAASDDDLFAHPAIAGTPAAQTQSVVRMDGLLLLGFGPRVGEAVRTLAGELSETAG
ncbi:heme/hemin ABC transporter substrate-binding protein [Maritimibacter dapengensis]|uniref:ABC transporter substrate-binding protein n=1 Tax=Maritimibacter dapengensis TaxID=2836868 RepID=A0ABS6SYG1_9RHOB|nr:ABC transporter substrate-binding protein [Maritimibacter dapengensis]MBV7378009.1 ABC transporter substrate-binding protein [Maritimibacter dapengensis]